MRFVSLSKVVGGSELNPMSRPAIIARNVGKTFQIGDRVVHDTLRDHLGATCRALLRPWLRRPSGASPPVDTSFRALDDISFEIFPGETVGVIGRNGAGKSTLLKILTQISEPTDGEIRMRGRVAALLEVGAGFHPELTGRENIYLNGSILGMSRAEIRRKFDEIVAFSEVEKFLDTPVKRYSSGMYVRLAFAVAAHLEADIMLVDEVLAVGDAAFQAKCMRKMGDITSGEGRTILFVSHNLAAVEQLCSRGFYLRGGRLTLDGPITKVLDAYQRSFEDHRAGDPLADVPEGGARFLRWELEGGALHEPHTCQTRETCTFVVTLKSRLQVKGAGMSFLLWDSEGRLVVAGNLWEKGEAPIDLGPGLHEFRVSVRLPIKPGLYQVDVRFYSRLQNEIDCSVLQPRLNVLPLDSAMTPRWQGVLTEPMDFRVQSPKMADP
jgi:lipopolysaccharide transport system ATP-binding protein